MDFSKAADQPPHSYQHFLQARHFSTDKNCSEGSGLCATKGGLGIKRELIIELDTSGLTSKTGEIMRYRAIDCCGEANRYFSGDVKGLERAGADCVIISAVSMHLNCRRCTVRSYVANCTGCKNIGTHLWACKLRSEDLKLTNIM